MEKTSALIKVGKLILVISLMILVGSVSKATLLMFEDQSLLINSKSYFKKASYDFENSKGQLQTLGAGLRIKKIAFVPIKVYEAQLLVSDLSTFDKKEDKALLSTEQQAAVAIQLRFLRNVESEKVISSFKEGLKKNDQSLDSESVKNFLEAVATCGEAKENTSMTLLGFPAQDTLVLECGDGKVKKLSGNKGIVKSVFSIWLGKAADSELEDLKKSLLGL